MRSILNVGKKKQGKKICSFQLRSGIVGEIKVKYSQYPTLCGQIFWSHGILDPPYLIEAVIFFGAFVGRVYVMTF